MKEQFQLLWICLSILAISINIAYSEDSNANELSIQSADESNIPEYASATPLLFAQVVNPADKQKKSNERSEQEEKPQEEQHLRTWELPPVTVYGKKELREEDRIGSYAQPRWSARRRFSETRIYVRPEGEFEFEYWLVPEFPKEGDREIMKQYELEMGLPYRFQLDLYIVSNQEGNEGPLNFDQEKFEVRWALADWGKIPTNPTLYLEWEAVDSSPDHIEAKLLFGGEIISRWHWGANLVFEHETGGEQENSNELTTGLSYTILDERLSLGAETKLALVDTKADRGNFSKEFLIGPSLQYRPLPQAHIDLSTLLGTTSDSPKDKTLMVLGWEF